LAAAPIGAIVRRMSNTKRVLAAVLWFYAGWYAGDMIASFLGLGPVFGILLGTAASSLVTIDPRRVIWTRRFTNQAA
jgi:hypothetical protein